MKKMLIVLLPFVSTLLLAACGGGDSAPATLPGPPVTPTPGTSSLYIGYYTESPDADKEDPTPGVLYAFLPDDSTPFSGEFFFSYAGCVGSTDTGLLDGLRMNGGGGDSISGTWSGNVDGNIHSGAFSGNALADGIFTGTWTRNGGSQQFRFGKIPFVCRYTFAGRGDFTLYPVDTGTLPIDIDLTDPAIPVFRFDLSNMATWYGLNVFNADCLAAGGGVSACLKWHLRQTTSGGATTVTYGMGGSPAQPLQAASYVVTVISSDANGTVQDYGSGTFSGP